MLFLIGCIGLIPTFCSQNNSDTARRAIEGFLYQAVYNVAEEGDGLIIYYKLCSLLSVRINAAGHLYLQ